jgi:hypothetical protein
MIRPLGRKQRKWFVFREESRENGPSFGEKAEEMVRF